MKCRRKYFLKMIFFVTVGSFTYLVLKQVGDFSAQLQSLFNSHQQSIALDESVVNGRNLFIDLSFNYRPPFDKPPSPPVKPTDRRLTESRVISDVLFSKQGRFNLPSLEDLSRAYQKLPSNYSGLPIFPFESASRYDDRIWNQMRYVPLHSQQQKAGLKHILLYHGLYDVSNDSFSQCPVSKCFLSGDPDLAVTADVILWMHTLSIPIHTRPPGQIWALYLLESPFHTPKFPDFEKLGTNYTINWTATYRHESTLVTPYFKYTPYELANSSPNSRPSKRDYARGKTKLIAWFVSNCGSLNYRLQVVEELQKHIQVDIYGLCGSLKCPRERYKSCFQMLNRDYKFYLAFENSNCRDYITEKFFLNGLSNDVLPIVMGAPIEDYQRVAPPHSFIHLDQFRTVKELAEYLYYLNSDNAAYNAYFAWKGQGLVDTNSYFWCRLCMLAHEGDKVKSSFPNVYDWWFDKNMCTMGPKWTNDSIQVV